MTAVAAIMGIWLALGLMGLAAVPMLYSLYRWAGGKHSLRWWLRTL